LRDRRARHLRPAGPRLGVPARLGRARRRPRRRSLLRGEARRARGRDLGVPGAPGQSPGGAMSTGLLSRGARKDLLALARGAIEARFRDEPPPRLVSDKSETFGEPRALFVTLRRGEHLRGCIGTLLPEGDLSRTVPKFALRAAFEDPRFP